MEAGPLMRRLERCWSQMSYNNYLDVEAAYSAVCDFDDPTCVIVKVCVLSTVLTRLPSCYGPRQTWNLGT